MLFDILVTSEPQEISATSGSTASLVWTIHKNLTAVDFDISIVSRKNPLMLVRRRAGIVKILDNFEFNGRLTVITTGSTLGMIINSVIIADMGLYAINIPQFSIFNFDATLYIKGKKTFNVTSILSSMENFCMVMFLLLSG